MRNKTKPAVMIPAKADKEKLMGKITVEDSINARPCDCTSCSSCRCTPCK